MKNWQFLILVIFVVVGEFMAAYAFLYINEKTNEFFSGEFYGLFILYLLVAYLFLKEDLNKYL